MRGTNVNDDCFVSGRSECDAFFLSVGEVSIGPFCSGNAFLGIKSRHRCALPRLPIYPQAREEH